MPASRCFTLATLLLAAAPGWAPAGEGRDHDRARAAVAAGEVMPLPRLLQQVQKAYPGQVLEVELEREHGRWAYELRLLQPDGRLLKLQVDARTGEVMERHARRVPDAGR